MNNLFDGHFVRNNWEVISVVMFLWISEEIRNTIVRFRKLIRIVMKASACAGSFWLVRFMFRI
ncbi:MAG: hypothetical protein ACTS6G_06555 [Candidatus Hodgkinia cicadicola]